MLYIIIGITYYDSVVSLHTFLRSAFSLFAIFPTLTLAGVRGNLQESERCVGFSLALTLLTTLFAVYFLLWQAYVLQADVIIGAVLLVLYGLSGALGLVTLTRFMRSDHQIEG